MATGKPTTTGEQKMGANSEHWKNKFPAFPYEPYLIQVDFMNALYHSLDKGGIAMLESPTGTGKTLSVICSALQWLVDRKKQQNSAPSDHCYSDDEPDWLKSFVVKKDDPQEDKRKGNRKPGSVSSRLNKDNVGKSCGDLFCGGNGKLGNDCGNGKGENGSSNTGLSETSDDDDFLLEEYQSEEEEEGLRKRKATQVCDSPSSEEEGDGFHAEEESGGGLKVYFCSRTHSQLSQFVKELRKTVFGSELKVVSLASRKNFCVNEEIAKLGNPAHINERCLELQNKKDASKIKNLRAGGGKRRTKALSGCPMLRSKRLQEFRDNVLQDDALDIEDLLHLGKYVGVCPYYGTRSMVPSADLIVLPYHSLLMKSSRESLGINLKDSIIIIDEAHNLADSLIGMYDASITLSQLQNVHSCFKQYFERFCNRLGAGNRRYIQTLLILTRSFLRIILEEIETNHDAHYGMEKTVVGKLSSESTMAINDFLFSLNIDNINFVKLISYIKDSKIMHKVCGYREKVSSFEKHSEHRIRTDEEGSVLSGFQALVDLLSSLTNNNSDGRIIISRAKSASSGKLEGSIKYVMLTGEKIFSEIAHQAHSIILTGGTLQPIEETWERLFPWISRADLHFFSCNHIIPSESILPVAISSGPSGLSFDFSYNSRGLPKMIEELGLLLCNLVTIVPEGIVVFFSSFEYEGQVYDAWKASGLMQRIMKKKRIFREPRSNTEVETVLKEYKETIERLSNTDPKAGQPQPSQTGAVLLAVVGAKISEGINFSDGMGRCIVMVGLPYPNPSDVVLMERVKHLEGIRVEDVNQYSQGLGCGYGNGDIQAGFNILKRCKGRGKEYYENLCMKAVNQSIGRAIRHINDYAAILLVDSRYSYDPLKGSSSHPAKKLPQWIKHQLVSVNGGYGEVHRRLNQFFRYNRRKG